MKVKISDIEVAHLNARSVIVLSQFVRLARVREGANLRLQHPRLLRLFLNTQSAPKIQS